MHLDGLEVDVLADLAARVRDVQARPVVAVGVEVGVDVGLAVGVGVSRGVAVEVAVGVGDGVTPAPVMVMRPLAWLGVTVFRFASMKKKLFGFAAQASGVLAPGVLLTLSILNW